MKACIEQVDLAGIRSGVIKSNPSVIALGTFDGVHLGHQAILDRAARQARVGGLESIAFTFDRLPLELLSPQEAPRLLCSPQERLRLLSLYVDRVVSIRFDHSFADLPPLQFVEEVLVEGLGCRGIVVGFNHRFGRKGEGHTDILRALCASLCLRLIVVPPVETPLGLISSTAIRQCVANGDPESAAAMLGRPFSLIGEVVKGESRGRGLGFPTANLACHERQLLPAEGVYVSEIWSAAYDDESFSDASFFGEAVTAVSRQPTFDGRDVSVESFILDYSDDLYGQMLEVRLLHRLREPRRFATAKRLQTQIEQDVADARDYFRALRLQGHKGMINLPGRTLG